MADIDNNKLIAAISEWGLLLSQEHIKERRKQKQWGNKAKTLNKKER